MKAQIIKAFGGPEQLVTEELMLPKPKRKQVLVKIHAAGVNPVDYKIRNGSIKYISGSKFPKILGGDIAGVVEQDGKEFRVGDKVFAMLNFEGGGYAEFIAVKESQLCKIPDGISFEQAAAVPLAALTALQALMKKGIGEESSVLVNGASGGVGHFAIQIAKAMGANVAGVCSKRNVDFVRSLGADVVIDYTYSDFTKSTLRYDLVFDAVATSSFGKCKKLLKPDGYYITTVPNHSMIWHRSFNAFRKKKAFFIMAKPIGSDLNLIADYMHIGKLTAHIEATFPLNEASRAHQAIENGRTRGKLVLKVVH